MRNRHKIQWLLATLTVLILATANSAKASSVAYEPFDSYTAGTTISGGAGGSGFAAAWLTGSGAFIGTNVSGGLSYVDTFGNTLVTSGGSMQVGSPFGDGG